MTIPHDDNDRPLWSEPDEPASFLAAHNIQQQLLEKLSEPSGPSAAEMADLLGQWPAEANKESDVAGAMFEDFRNRSLRGESISRAKHDQETPLHDDSLASLFRRQDFLRSARSISQPSAPMFALPKVGDEFAANESFGSVESVKAVSEVFSPVSGEVVGTNETLGDAPEQVNTDPYGEGWMIRVEMTKPGEVDSMLTAAEYEDFTKAEKE